MLLHSPFDPRVIRVIDDFLPDYDPTAYSDYLKLGQNYRGHADVGDDLSDQQLSFYSVLKSQYDRALSSVGLPSVDSIQSQGILVADHSSDYHRGIHKDGPVSSRAYLISYHWLGQSGCGGTVFYQNNQGLGRAFPVEFRPNRLVIFPNRLWHTGYSTTTENSTRVILGATVLVKSQVV